MKTRIIVAVLIVLALLCGIACTQKTEAPAALPGYESGKVYKGAWLNPMPCEEESLFESLENCGDWVQYGLAQEEYYDSLTAMLLDMEAGRLDYFSVPESVARYLQRGMPGMNYYKDTLVSCRFMMATLPGNEALVKELDATIALLQADGTIEGLVKDWVTDLPAGDPVSKPLDKLPDARTVRIGVTGDLPPLDYVAADGTAAGFNVELLRAIGERLSINFEVIQIEANARLAALQAERIDAVFWVVGYAPSELDSTQILTTRSYFEDYNATASNSSDMDKVITGLYETMLEMVKSGE